jgi:uncharacterized protein
LTNNLLLSGGPTHDFAATSHEIASLLHETAPSAASITTTIVQSPTEFFDLLRAAAEGKREPWNLVTVNALRWRMEAARYASQRAEWAYEIDPVDLALIAGHVTSGGGLLAMHTAAICFDADPTWRRLLGAAWNWERSSHPEVASVFVDCTIAGTAHPVTAELEPFAIVDEIYGFLDQVDDIEPLLTATHGALAHPVLWARLVGSGRVVTDLLGHGVESLTHPTHRTILRRAAAWAIGDR